MISGRTAFVFLCSAAISLASTHDRLTLDFFGSPTCGECMQIKQEILFPLEKKHSVIDLKIHDVDTDSGYKLIMAMEDRFRVPTSSSIELFFPDTFLIGAEDILKHGHRMILRYLEHPETWKPRDMGEDTTSLSGRLAERFSGFSFLGILTAGIIDGINPCAIATMIFLISFLATQKRKRREVLAIGLSFTAAVFITYLGMGVGAFKALSFLQKNLWVSQTIRWGAAALAVIFGLLSFRDAIVFHKTGKASEITLQLPEAVKMRIHKVISGNLSGKSLVIGAVVTGFLVTLLEAVCTGQVYLPTIVLMTRQKGLQLTGWLYLIFYNFLFVLPLLIVMILAFFGLRWDRLAKTTRKNMVAIKIALGSVLCGLAIFITLAV